MPAPVDTPPRKQRANEITIDANDKPTDLPPNDDTQWPRPRRETIPATPHSSGMHQPGPTAMTSTIFRRQSASSDWRWRRRRSTGPILVATTPPVAVHNTPSQDSNALKQSRFTDNLALTKRLNSGNSAQFSSRVATTKIHQKPIFKAKAPNRPDLGALVGHGARHEEMRRMIGWETVSKPMDAAIQMRLDHENVVMKSMKPS